MPPVEPVISAPAASPVAPATPAPTPTPTITGVDVAQGGQDKTVATPAPVVTDAPKADAPPAGWSDRVAKYAKGDEKLAKQLSRYSSEEAVMDALLAAQKKISSGALKTALPENATPEQLNAWRVENGIPVSVEDYEVELPEDMDLPPEMESMIDAFAEEAHNANYTPAQLEAGLNFLVKHRQAAKEAQDEKDINARVDAEEALRSEWGPEYKLNTNLINSLLDGAPEGVKDQLLSARLPDGTLFGNNATVARWLANLAREVNPVASVVPQGGKIEGIGTELDMIKSVMRDSPDKYWKNKEMQERFLVLTEAQEKHKARN